MLYLSSSLGGEGILSSFEHKNGSDTTRHRSVFLASSWLSVLSLWCMVTVPLPQHEQRRATWTPFGFFITSFEHESAKRQGENTCFDCHWRWLDSASPPNQSRRSPESSPCCSMEGAFYVCSLFSCHRLDQLASCSSSVTQRRCASHANGASLTQTPGPTRPLRRNSTPENSPTATEIWCGR